MRWQLGGNLEPVRIICETDWRQCPRAILKYIWTEVVTDVVDCLIAEETAWRTIAILIACMMLLRVLYGKRKCANKPIPSEETLNRVGCKVEDLELKINILTYKLQYGTWPLPHQIRNPALKKQLRNLRLTLSTSGDRNAWIKRMLNSSTADIHSSSHPKLDSASVQRIAEIFDTKTGYVPSEINRDITSTDYTDVKTSSKTTSAESLEKNDPKNSNPCGLSKSENLGKLHSTGTRFSLLQQNDTSLECLNWRKAQKQKRSKFPTSQSTLAAAPCDRYTESIRECKRFLQEVKKSNKVMEPEYSSSSMLSNDDSFMKETCRDEKVISTRCIVPEITKSIELEFSLNEQNRIISGDVTFSPLKSSLHAQTTDARNATRRCEYVGGGVEKIPKKVEREEKNFEKMIMNREISIRDAPNDLPQAYRVPSNGSMPSLNSTTGHDNLTTNFPIEPSTNIDIPPCDNVIEMSREALHMIRDKLENLDDVLRASYGMLNSRVPSIVAPKENANDIPTIYRNVIDTLDNMKVEIESINETRKNVIYFGLNARKYSNKLVQTTKSDRGLSKRTDESSLPPMIKKNPLANVVTRNQQCAVEEWTKINAGFTQPRSIHDELVLNNQKEQKASPYSQISTTTYVKTSGDSSTREIFLARNGMEKLSRFPVPMETDEDPSITSTTSSQHEMSKDGDFESESTALLIREALECKRELLSRVKLQKFYSNIELGQDNEKYKNNFKSDNVVYRDTERTFASKLFDIIAEERSISGRTRCTDKTSRTYIFLRMEQPISKLSDRSLLSLKLDLNDSKQEELSKDAMIPVRSSRYFSLDNFAIDRITHDDRSDALHDFRELRNIIFEKFPTDNEELHSEKIAIKDANSLRGKKRHKEIATSDDNDVDDNRKKRLCYRANVQSSPTSSLLHRPKSGQHSYRIKRSNVRRYSRSVSTITNIDKFLKDSITDSIELFGDLTSSTIIKDKRMFVESDERLSSNKTIESSSSGNIEHRFAIDNGSMTNFLSNTDSNVKMIKLSHDLGLKGCPDTFSFAHPEMNTQKIPKDPSNLFITNPYFFTETTLSEATCEDTIEINLVPLSASTATIDSSDSRIFTLARSNILKDITGVSSTLQIYYKDDIENGNIPGIIKNELGDNEVLATRSVKSVDRTTNIQENQENYDKDTITNINQIEERMQQSEDTKIEATNLKFLSNHTYINNAGSIDNEDSTKSRSTVISQQSSSYFTGDTLSSTDELDVESFEKSNGNIEGDPDVRRIAIKAKIVESCTDFCLDSLNDKQKSNTNGISLQTENETSIECVDNVNDRSNETSVTYVDANISQTFDDNARSRYEASIIKERQKRSELFFDGSIPYRKLSTSRSFVRNVKETLPPQTRNPNSIKSKPTKVDVKSKNTISVDRPTYSKKSPTSDSQLKGKSNFSIICNNGKDLPTESTGSHKIPSICSLSRDRSRSSISSRKGESFSPKSTVAVRSEDKSKEKEMLRDKPKSGTHRSEQSFSSPKSFSKSCIPVLKSRLEARKGEQMSRPKSPMRGPLTMTGSRRNKIDDNVQNITEVSVPTEGCTVRKEKSQRHLHNSETTKEEIDEEKSSNAQFITGSHKIGTNIIDKNCVSLTTPREQTVLYVNIVQQRDRDVTRLLDPERFLEYAKGESITQKESNMKLEPDMLLPKIVTIVSSVSSEPNVNAKDDNGSSNLRVSTGILKSLWSVTIQQKEIEVTAKPSVMDISTSISDLHGHRIFGIPKEFTDEEYSCMLKILTQKTNLAHPKRVQNLCNRLKPKNENSD